MTIWLESTYRDDRNRVVLVRTNHDDENDVSLWTPVEAANGQVLVKGFARLPDGLALEQAFEAVEQVQQDFLKEINKPRLQISHDAPPLIPNGRMKLSP